MGGNDVQLPLLKPPTFISRVSRKDLKVAWLRVYQALERDPALYDLLRPVLGTLQLAQEEYAAIHEERVRAFEVQAEARRLLDSLRRQVKGRGKQG